MSAQNDDVPDPKFIVGLKQVTKVILEGRVGNVWIASDADAKIVSDLKALCQQHQCSFEMVSTKKELGEKAGIEVSAAVICTEKES